MAEDPSQIREAIEGTRAEIAQTIEALGQKADVKSRLSEQVRDKKQEIKIHAASSVEQLKAKVDTVEEQARSVLPESAYPAVDRVMTQLRQAGDSIASDPSRRRGAATVAAVIVLVLIRRRRKRRNSR